MKFLTTTEIEAEVALQPQKVRQVITSALPQRLQPDFCFHLPSEARRLTALGRVISGLMHFDKKPIIWIADTSVWSSEEDLDILRGYRRGLGEFRGEYEVPAVLFDDNDAHGFLSIVRMSLFFMWDTWIFEAQSDRICMEISHDEVLSIWSEDEITCKTIEDYFKRLGMVKI
jgi:hypothetical protein